MPVVDDQDTSSLFYNEDISRKRYNSSRLQHASPDSEPLAGTSNLSTPSKRHRNLHPHTTPIPVPTPRPHTTTAGKEMNI